MTIRFSDYLKEQKNIIDCYIRSIINENPGHLNKVIEYSVLAEGKRFRPILIIAIAQSLGVDYKIALPSACALEFIHCFSLIHDDLPCLDNDDYRRGRLSCHRKFGEAEALLAGDALMIKAFEILVSSKLNSEICKKKQLAIIEELAVASGSSGMIGGQFLEINVKPENSGKLVDENDILKVHSLKTGALIRAAVRIGAILADASEDDLKNLTVYGEKIGLLFQIVDDILDSKTKSETMNFVTLYGVDGSREKAEEIAREAENALKDFKGNKEILEQIISFLLNREK